MEKTIALNSKIYPQASIEESLSDFKEFLKCSMKQEDIYISLTITTNQDDDEIIKEFLNYLLAKSKNELYTK